MHSIQFVILITLQSKFDMLVKVTEVEHYTERLFRFRTERPATFRFSAGEFTMVGIENAESVIQKEPTALLADHMITFLNS